jgi:glycosyltransferase involved in cell wall biosynthesis
MIAYACDPQGSGEHWLGWGWAEQAAQNHEVDLITTPKARESVETRCRELGITPHFIEGSATVRKVTESAGGGWLRKLSWQKRAARVAAGLHQAKRFQIVHQTTFHSFRMPFLAASLGIPSVWGPIAGGERVPTGFEVYLGRARLAETSRAVVNRIWRSFPPVKRSFEDARVIFASNRVTQCFLPDYCRGKSRIVPPNTLRPDDERQAEPVVKSSRDPNNLKVLYVGNCVATRALPIVFDALHESGLTNYEFSIIGDGPAIADWKARVLELNLQTRVKFLGRIPQAELGAYYAAADALVFPALRDSGGSALLEAMARFVPVICLDWAGPGEMVDDQSGIKIPVVEPEGTVAGFARALRSLAENPERGVALARAARARAMSLFRWQAKRHLLEETYAQLLSRE